MQQQDAGELTNKMFDVSEPYGKGSFTPMPSWPQRTSPFDKQSEISTKTLSTS